MVSQDVEAFDISLNKTHQCSLERTTSSKLIATEEFLYQLRKCYLALVETDEIPPASADDTPYEEVCNADDTPEDDL